MKIEEHTLEDLPGTLRALDLTQDGGWVAVSSVGAPSYDRAERLLSKYADRGVELSEQQRLHFMHSMREDKGQVLLFNGREVQMPEILRFPIVRAIGEDAAVVVNARGYPRNPLKIIDADGIVRLQFDVGDAIEEILVSDTWIVVTYFDERAALGEGIEVFDLSGKLRLSYERDFSDAVDISDCYCACWAESDKLAFYPYTKFPLVQLNLNDLTQMVWETPRELHGSHALSIIGDAVYFHSPYDSRDDIFKWKLDSDKASKVGQYVERLRGLPGGRFLAFRETSYTILSFGTDEVRR